MSLKTVEREREREDGLRIAGCHMRIDGQGQNLDNSQNTTEECEIPAGSRRILLNSQKRIYQNLILTVWVKVCGIMKQMGENACST